MVRKTKILGLNLLDATDPVKRDPLNENFEKLDRKLATPDVTAGTICWYASQTAPKGYLICDGSTVSRTTYAALFAAIGTKFGGGDGKTTFQLPDLRAAFVRGAGSAGGYSASFSSKASPTMWSPSSTGGKNIISPDGTGSVSLTVDDWVYEDHRNFSPTSITTYAFRPYNIALTPIIKY